MSDYNDWRQRGSEPFCLWDYSSKSKQVQFRDSQLYTDWYNWYDYNTTAPAAGTGHYHDDAHSVSVEPPFTNAASHDYITAAFPGTNLANMPWYIPEMGLVETGKLNSTWAMGPYEPRKASEAREEALAEAREAPEAHRT